MACARRSRDRLLLRLTARAFPHLPCGPPTSVPPPPQGLLLGPGTGPSGCYRGESSGHRMSARSRGMTDPHRIHRRIAAIEASPFESCPSLRVAPYPSRPLSLRQGRHNDAEASTPCVGSTKYGWKQRLQRTSPAADAPRGAQRGRFSHASENVRHRCRVFRVLGGARACPHDVAGRETHVGWQLGKSLHQHEDVVTLGLDATAQLHDPPHRQLGVTELIMAPHLSDCKVVLPGLDNRTNGQSHRALRRCRVNQRRPGRADAARQQGRHRDRHPPTLGRRVGLEAVTANQATALDIGLRHAGAHGGVQVTVAPAEAVAHDGPGQDFSGHCAARGWHDLTAGQRGEAQHQECRDRLSEGM